jgi:hypothetical protein
VGAVLTADAGHDHKAADTPQKAAAPAPKGPAKAPAAPAQPPVDKVQAPPAAQQKAASEDSGGKLSQQGAIAEVKAFGDQVEGLSAYAKKNLDPAINQVASNAGATVKDLDRALKSLNEELGESKLLSQMDLTKAVPNVHPAAAKPAPLHVQRAEQQQQQASKQANGALEQMKSLRNAIEADAGKDFWKQEGVAQKYAQLLEKRAKAVETSILSERMEKVFGLEVQEVEELGEGEDLVLGEDDGLDPLAVAVNEEKTELKAAQDMEKAAHESSTMSVTAKKETVKMAKAFLNIKQSIDQHADSLSEVDTSESWVKSGMKDLKAMKQAAQNVAKAEIDTSKELHKAEVEADAVGKF